MHSKGLMKEKIRAHEECAAAGVCPLNRPFSSEMPCVNGKSGKYDCSGIDMKSFVPIAALGSTMDASDIWGWTDSSTGDEIAIINVMDGTSFVQITDPVNPIVLGFLPSTSDNHVVWADTKVFNDFAFIVRESRNSGVQIYDLTKLRPYYGVATSFPRTLEHDVVYDQVTSTHNAVMNEETGFLYLVGTKTCQGGLHVVDVHEPLKPTFAGCFDEDGYTHDAQCVIYRGSDTKYVGKEICFNYNEDTLTIVDVSDKSDMKMLGRETYDNAEYTHQGWLTPDMKFLLLNDELDEQYGPDPRTRTMMWKLDDLSAPELIASHYPPDGIVSIDHNLYITKDDTAYLSDYTSGLRVLDTSTIADGITKEIAFFDMCDYSDKVEFKGAWSSYPYFDSKTIITSSIELGLFVLKMS
jgi:choice-of-anchor B domain-containing protein